MNVETVTDCLIGFDKKRNGQPITQLDVQKHLYFIQGFHLALCHEPLFPDDLYAWRNGPVVKSVWQRLKSFGDRPIPKTAMQTRGAQDLPEGSRNLIERVWHVFSVVDTGGLVGLTHLRGTPWEIVRTKEGIGWGDPSDVLIPKHLLSEYFSRIMDTMLEPDDEHSHIMTDDEWNALAA